MTVNGTWALADSARRYARRRRRHDMEDADIWLRREITIPANADASRLQFLAYHDEDVDIYINGVLPPARQATSQPMSRSRSARRRRSLLQPSAKSSWLFTATRRREGRGSTSAWWMSMKERNRIKLNHR